MLNKKCCRAYFFPLIMTGLLVMGFVVNISAVGAVVTTIISVVILCSSVKRASCLLFYFSNFSNILQFGTFNLTIFPAIAYIINIFCHDVVLRKRLNVRITAICLLVLTFCILFKSPYVTLKLGDLIMPLLLMLIILTCKSVKKKDCREVVSYFINGLILATTIGFFKFRIPSMGRLFELDHLYINGSLSNGNIERFSGLAYDPNFLSMLICVAAAYIMFCYNKISKFNVIRLAILVGLGMLTFSKSYFLMIGALFLIYVLKNTKHFFRTVGLLVFLLGCELVIEYFTDINIISLALERFNGLKNINELTSGRIEVWMEYIHYIMKDTRTLMLGTGFNGKALEYAAHNSFIEMVYKFGLVGSTIWLFYFVNCFSTLKRAWGGRTHIFELMPMITCLVAITFLSAFHFPQLWVCLAIGFFAMYCIDPSVSVEE